MGLLDFLKPKRKPPMLSKQEAEDLLRLLEEWPAKWVSEIKDVEGSDARLTIKIRAEFACAIIAVVELWHQSRDKDVRDYYTIRDVLRGTLENKVAGLIIFESISLGRIKASELVSNRVQIYLGTPAISNGKAFEAWSDVFSRLVCLSENKIALEIHPVISGGGVQDLLLSKGLFENALDSFCLKTQFLACFRHQIPVLLDLIKTFHEARLGRILD